MDSELNDIVSRAHQLARERKRGDAMLLANEAVQRFGDKMDAWLLRGYLWELLQDYDKAVADLTRAITLNAMEPHLYYSRGRYLFQMDNVENAVADFSRALELCDFYKSDYYRDELSFWRAESFLKLGNKDAAFRDVVGLPNDFSSWTYALRTKHDVMADCGR